jgi:cytochrome c551/c552
MNRFINSLVAGVSFLVAANALASDLQTLTQKYNCTNCHAENETVVGPSWKDISMAYNSNGRTSKGIPVSYLLASKTNEQWLLHKISYGGAGVWGTKQMPANDADDRWKREFVTLVKYILDLSEGTIPNELAHQRVIPALAEKHSCNRCHAINKKIIGPAWMDVSKIYNSNGTTPYGVKVSDILKSKTPEEYLILKVSHGGAGNWGVKSMPAMEYSDSTQHIDSSKVDNQINKDIKKMVGLILDLTKLPPTH